MHNHDVTSWFHGTRVPTLAVGAVAVAPERRGTGLVHTLLDTVLADARERGTAISTLYPSAPGIYRRAGYEVIGSLDHVDLPLDRVARTAPPATALTTRRATAADTAAITAVHTAWAQGQNGPLTRSEPPFRPAPEDLPATAAGTTLAVDDTGDVVGLLTWRRGEGWDPATTVMQVDDICTLTPDAARTHGAVRGAAGARPGRLLTWADAGVRRSAARRSAARHTGRTVRECGAGHITPAARLVDALVAARAGRRPDCTWKPFLTDSLHAS